MNRKCTWWIIGSAIAVIVLSVDIGQGRAEPQMTRQDKPPTLNFRDPNNVMKMHKVTHSQRLEAAKRTAERRAKASAGASVPTDAATPQNTEGGTK